MQVKRLVEKARRQDTGDDTAISRLCDEVRQLRQKLEEHDELLWEFMQVARPLLDADFKFMGELPKFKEALKKTNASVPE